MEPAIRRIIGELRRSPNWDSELDLELLRKFWPDLVGEQIAAAVTVVDVEESRLILRAVDRTWRQQLLLMRGGLLARINELWPVPWIKEIAFVHEDYRS